MQITMIGAGYVGLVSGTCFADFGHDVTCIDTNQEKIESLQAGRIPIYEPGLSDLVSRNVRAKRLRFSTVLATAVPRSDVVFIAVGTPARQDNVHADLTYVYEAARQVAAVLDGYTVIVTKSTVPVGTGDEVEEIIRSVRPDAEFAVVSNPEFLREGAAIEDFKRPDRIVVGTDDERARKVMSDLYRPLNLNRPPLLFMSRRGSELTKYAANAFLATKITFINEIADLCEKIGANVQDVARGMGLDNRIGSKFLHAGPGYGGSCFPKDTMALIQTGQQAGSPIRIVETVAASNADRKKAMAVKIIDACGGEVAGKTIAVLGLAFKPNTDDMRDSPSLDIIPALLERGAKVKAHDPESMDVARSILPPIDYCDDPYECAVDAHALVIVTEWDAFRALDLDRIRSLLVEPLIVDLRNIYRPDEMSERGFRYLSIGRP
jgi:UDPglucose 6-dehydrogenase